MRAHGAGLAHPAPSNTPGEHEGLESRGSAQLALGRAASQGSLQVG